MMVKDVVDPDEACNTTDSPSPAATSSPLPVSDKRLSAGAPVGPTLDVKFSALNEDLTPELIDHLVKLGEEHASQGFRLEHLIPGVGTRTFLLNARRMPGDRPLVLLALEDITAREHIERALEQREAEFSDMMAMAAEAIIMSNSTGRIIFANPAAKRMFGFTQEEIVGLAVDALVPARPGESRYAEFSSVPYTPPTGNGRNLTGRRRDLTEFPIEIRLREIVRNGELTVVNFITDVTQRAESERKIRKYQNQLQSMAFDAAVAEERERRRIAVDLHDRIGQALALARMKLMAARQAVKGGAIRGAIDEAVELLAQSIVDTRTLTFDLSPPILYDLGLKDALSWLVEDVEKRCGLKVKFVADEVPTALDDATAALVFRSVREVVMNVVKHARSPMASLRLRRTDHHIEVQVQDAGVGFDPGELAAHTTNGSFGLFSVREQIDRLGGTVEVASAAGRGTHVSLRVPLLLKTDPGSRPDLDPREGRR